MVKCIFMQHVFILSDFLSGNIILGLITLNFCIYQYDNGTFN